MKYKSKLTIKIEYAGNQRQSVEYNYENRYSESMKLYRLLEKLAYELSLQEEAETTRELMKRERE